MDEIIIDEIFNDEANNIRSLVEVPLGYGRTITCKTTLVKNAKRLIKKIAIIIEKCLFVDVQVYDTTEDGVFVIAIAPIGNVHKTKIKRLQDALRAEIDRELVTGGCVEIEVYRDVHIYMEEYRVEVDECIYKPNTFSHEKPLEDDFVDILTREYDSTFEKTTIAFPQIII